MEYIIAIIVVAAAGIAAAYAVKRAVILEFERGLRYDRGRFTSVLEPGAHWHLPFFTTIEKLDIRPRFVSILGQEVLSADGVALKVSLAANFEVVEPDAAVNKVASFQEALYLELQLALREIIGEAEIDDVLASRQEMSRKLMERTAPRAEALGLKLHSVSVKDIMFPGNLREIFAQVVSARKEGQAALEKARGETAALRNLANAAKMLDDNPNLLQLRLVQAMAETSGNTYVLGLPSPAMPIPAAGPKGGEATT